MEQMSDLIVFLVVFSSTVLLFLLFFVAKLIFDAMKNHRESRKQIQTANLRPASRLSIQSQSNSLSNNNNNNRSLSSECGDSLTFDSLKRKSSPTNSKGSASLDSAVWTTSSASNSLKSKFNRVQSLKDSHIPTQNSQNHQNHILENIRSLADPMNREPYNTVKIVEQTNCKVHPFRITYCTKV